MLYKNLEIALEDNPTIEYDRRHIFKPLVPDVVHVFLQQSALSTRAR
jgi:hypothetical protein